MKLLSVIITIVIVTLLVFLNQEREKNQLLNSEIMALRKVNVEQEKKIKELEARTLDEHLDKLMVEKKDVITEQIKLLKKEAGEVFHNVLNEFSKTLEEIADYNKSRVSTEVNLTITEKHN